MDPEADVAADRCAWIHRAELPEELSRLALLIDDDAVGRAPPDLQRHARRCNRTRVGDRAALGERERALPRRAAELGACEHLQAASERLAEVMQTVRVAAQLPERAVLLREVRH